MQTKRLAVIVTPVLLMLLTGCSGRTVTLRVQEVINTWGPDNKAQQLDVDIVCLTKEEVENNPDLVNGTTTSKEWFELRDKDSTKVDPKHIYSFRPGKPGDRRDTLVGDALVGSRDSTARKDSYVVKINHPGALNDKAAIVIFGRFYESGSVLKRQHPLIYQPVPSQKDIIIEVSRQTLTKVSPT